MPFSSCPSSASTLIQILPSLQRLTLLKRPGICGCDGIFVSFDLRVAFSGTAVSMRMAAETVSGELLGRFVSEEGSNRSMYDFR